jgi:hypothetical protein
MNKTPSQTSRAVFKLDKCTTKECIDRFRKTNNIFVKGDLNGMKQ